MHWSGSYTRRSFKRGLPYLGKQICPNGSGNFYRSLVGSPNGPSEENAIYTFPLQIVSFAMGFFARKYPCRRVARPQSHRDKMNVIRCELQATIDPSIILASTEKKMRKIRRDRRERLDGAAFNEQMKTTTGLKAGKIRRSR